MVTIDALRQMGADVDDGLARCMNMESFYLDLVNMALKDPGFEKLSDAVKAGDNKAAFEAAHDLKGIVANLSITPLSNEISEMTELLRKDQEADYQGYVDRILDMRNKLSAL